MTNLKNRQTMSHHALKTFLKEWGIYGLLMTLFILSRLFLWNPVTVDGHSMDPTLSDKEKLIVLKHTTIERFDIVVADSVNDQGEATQIVKRVIGMPGDTISYDNDILTINGEVFDEPYLDEYLKAFQTDHLQSTYSYNTYFQQLAARSTSFTTDANFSSSFTVVVPEGEYFLVGDDRIVSKDSRHVGTYSKDSLVGEVKLRYWPLLDFHLF